MLKAIYKGKEYDASILTNKMLSLLSCSEDDLNNGFMRAEHQKDVNNAHFDFSKF